VYEAVYFLAQRQFSRAAKLFLASVATFTTYELFDYETCIFYTVVTSIITLPRLELKKQVCPFIKQDIGAWLEHFLCCVHLGAAIVLGPPGIPRHAIPSFMDLFSPTVL
jgi:hypothetical protein